LLWFDLSSVFGNLLGGIEQFAGKMLIVLFIACRLKYYEAEPEINLSHE